MPVFGIVPYRTEARTRSETAVQSAVDRLLLILKTVNDTIRTAEGRLAVASWARAKAQFSTRQTASVVEPPAPAPSAPAAAPRKRRVCDICGKRGKFVCDACGGRRGWRCVGVRCAARAVPGLCAERGSVEALEVGA